VGQLFDWKATFDTFFDAHASSVYGIQIIPITPISEELLSSVWVNDAWPKMSSSLAQPGAIFFDFLYGAHAVVASSTAWGEMSGLSGFDDGNSRTNALWWVGTRP
jgi:endo-1,3(4)-beta-glucanase